MQVAGNCSSSAGGIKSCATLMPIPRITSKGSFPSQVVSERIPQTFFLRIRISFGHLISAGNFQPRMSASQTPTPASDENNAIFSLSPGLGRKIRLNARAEPGTVSHLRACLPRPAVWVSAITMQPSSAPSLVHCIAASFVDPIVEKYRISGTPRLILNDNKSVSFTHSF